MIKNITLEMSLKPFKQTDHAFIQKVCESVMEQWKPLVKQADCISVLMWSADGSELLDYAGRFEDPFEWCYFIGGANVTENYQIDKDPGKIGLHSRNYLYMENPPVMTYGILKEIVTELKAAARKVLGHVQVRVGTTFDPGPEFAISSFKYERHPEICKGSEMGVGSMVCAYAVLKGDDRPYAAYPHGIPEGTPLGTFMGKQAQAFLTDMGFDYIWMSNGMGFGRETWSTYGAVFDGKEFHSEALEEVKNEVLKFWSLFRAECPSFPIETRGTNLSMAIDYATDGVPLKEIYNGGFDLLPPPNSPWAGLDGDFGKELMGHMSRIAYVPEDRYLFRFYLHDIWWMNSPWYDRYNSQPHDIYLPLAIARIDETGSVKPPTHLNILSIDNCMGDMPDACANECIPHLQKAMKQLPDAPAPLVWVYPFDEYSQYKSQQELKEMFFEDWFIRGAINEGFPLSAVTSAANFVKQDKGIYEASVLVTPVPAADTEFEEQILDYVQEGGKVIFYGNVTRAGKRFWELTGLEKKDSLQPSDEISGVLDISVDGSSCGRILHQPLICGGGLSTQAVSDENHVFVTIGGKAAGIWGGNFVWLRGTVSCDLGDSREPVPHKESEYFIGETLMRKSLALLGYEILFEKETEVKSPVIMLHRNNNAYIVSVYAPSTTVKTKMKFPFGAPVLDGYETRLEDGYAVYHFPKAEHRECRVFVEQAEGIVGCRELPPVSYQYRRRIEVTGLKNATVRFLAEEYCKDNIAVVLNSHVDYYCVGDAFEGHYREIQGILFYEAEHVTGDMVFSMPSKRYGYLSLMQGRSGSDQDIPDSCKH